MRARAGGDPRIRPPTRERRRAQRKGTVQRALPALALVLALVAPGLVGPPSSGAAAGTSSSPPSCLAATTWILPGWMNGAGGHDVLGFLVRDEASWPCGLYGYPVVTPVDESGLALPVDEADSADPDRYLQLPVSAPTPVLVPPGGTAWFVIGYSGVEEPVTAAAGVDVALAGWGRPTLVLQRGFSFDASGLSVSPVQPGPSPFGGNGISPPEAASSRDGRGLVQEGGGAVSVSGDAVDEGSIDGAGLNAPIDGLAVDPTTGGYWMCAADGGVFAFGAPFHGSMPGTSSSPVFLNQPVVAMAATPDGGGYWLAAADGGVFAFGDAGFYGSMASTPLRQPVVAIAATADGRGYWLVGADGGVFAFGDAVYHGSMGGTPMNEFVQGITADPLTGGYWLLGADGGVFAFGAPFFGSGAGAPTPPGEVALVTAPPGGADAGAGYAIVGLGDVVTTYGATSF